MGSLNKLLVVGDVILDRYINGSTTRISPEAPVPIVKFESDLYRLGGASNVAHNLVNLGITTAILGAIGQDSEGKILRELHYEKNIEPLLFISDQIPTTSKLRILSRNQQMIRLDKESNFNHNSKSLEFIKTHFAPYGMIVVSDYGKGYCSEDFFDMLYDSIAPGTKVLIDPKGRAWEKYNGAFLVKPNLKELEEIYGQSIINTDEEVEKICNAVFNIYNFTNLIVTRGHMGMTLINALGVRHFPTQKVEVYDVSGAGDTAMAVLAFCLLDGSSIEESIRIANLASSYVVSKPMTHAITKSELDAIV